MATVIPIKLSGSAIVVGIRGGPRRVGTPIGGNSRVYATSVVCNSRIITAAALITTSSIRLSALLGILGSVGTFFSLATIGVIVTIIIVNLTTCVALTMDGTGGHGTHHHGTLRRQRGSRWAIFRWGVGGTIYGPVTNGRGTGQVHHLEYVHFLHLGVVDLQAGSYQWGTYQGFYSNLFSFTT